jgi:predicted ester cyclase
MSVESTARVMNEYVEALLNGGDFARFFADDVSWLTVETGDRIQGRDAVRDYIVAFHTQLFDAHPEVKTVAVGDGVAGLELDFVGTHTGEFAGIPPTGASLRVPYTMFYDVGEDGIEALRGYLPIGEMVAQLQVARAGAEVTAPR